MRVSEGVNAEHITVILVRPQSPGNIGSAARAMRNMGLHRLALVAPERFPHPEARMMACGAESLLHQAQIYDTVPMAVASCHWLVGTSARRRRYRNSPLTPAALAQKLVPLSQQYHVGLLFGPEDAGLTSDELDLCQDLVVIPTAEAATSLNLAQAVMIVCYAITQEQYQTPSPPLPQMASLKEIEAMYDHLRSAFAIRGFSDMQAVDRVVLGLQRLFERTKLELRDVRLLRGIARQLSWALHQPPAESSEEGEMRCKEDITRVRRSQSEPGCTEPPG